MRSTKNQKKIKEEEEKLLQALENYDIPDSERKFLVKKINHITEKLLEKAKYEC